jgi:hypothetical protein
MPIGGVRPMIRRFRLGRQSDIRPGHLRRRLEAAKVIGLTSSLAAKAYLRVSLTDTLEDHASS